MINVENVSKNFGRTKALEDISFKIDKGEIVGFLGPNGAGKTTLMRILTCFFPPSEGIASVAGFDVRKDNLEVRRSVGYFLEKAPLYQDMSVYDFLKFTAEVRDIEKRNIKDRIDYVMTDCGIRNVASRLIKNLSKGYQQRICLAQALIHEPQVLILDEPTAGLDPEQVVEVRKLIKNLANERTVILSSHILYEVSLICKRVMILNKGKIVAMDTPFNLTDKIQKVTRTFVKIEGPLDLIINDLTKIPGILQVEKTTDDEENTTSVIIDSEKEINIAKVISQLVHSHNCVLHEMKPMVMSLEEIFLKIVSTDN